MEKNNTNDLRELQEQLSLLHGKLDNQTIIDDTQIGRIPQVKSMKAMSSMWLALAIVLLVIIEGFYGLYYVSLTHFDKTMSLFEQTILTPMDSLRALSWEELAPELQKRMERLTPEKMAEADSLIAMYRTFKKEFVDNPERMQQAMNGVKDIIYGGWMLVMNILITLIFVIVIVTQVFNIRVLNRSKLQADICSLTAQMEKVRTVHLAACATLTLLLAMLMPLILEFYEGMALGWKIVLVTIPALLALAEMLQFTSFKRYQAIASLDWGRFLYIRHTCDKIIRRMGGNNNVDSVVVPR